MRPIAKSFRSRNFDRAILVNNDLGADEIVQIGTTKVIELNNGLIEEYSQKEDV